MRKAVIVSLASILLLASWQAAASHGIVSPRDPSTNVQAPRDPHTGLVVSPHFSLLMLFSRGIFS